MATQETIARPAPFVEKLGEDLATQVTAQTAIPLVAPGTGGITQLTGETADQFAARQKAAQQFDIRKQSLAGLAPQIEGLSTLEQQARTRAQQGLGSFQPFLDQAQAASAATFNPQVAQQFMSPYQQQVIDASLAEFDRNKQIQEQRLRDDQAKLGVLGAGRAGVQLAEFGTGAARERALLQAGLLQQGFNQAASQRQQDITNRFGLATAAQGLGGFRSNLAQQQAQLGSAIQGLQGTDITRLGQLGSINQALEQARKDATREATRMAAFQPQEELNRFADITTGIMGGMRGTGTTTTNVPNPTPLQTALGVGSTLAGIYGAVTGNFNPKNLLAEGGRAGYKDGTGEEGIMKMASGDDPLLMDEYEKYVFRREGVYR